MMDGWPWGLGAMIYAYVVLIGGFLQFGNSPEPNLIFFTKAADAERRTVYHIPMLSICFGCFGINHFRYFLSQGHFPPTMI
jgi:hypothetical protein